MKRKSQEEYYRSTPLFRSKLLKEGGQLYWAFPFSEFSLQKECHSGQYCGLYYKPIIIVNDDSSVINKFETSLTDDASHPLQLPRVYSTGYWSNCDMEISTFHFLLSNHFSN
jgi:hypothetical protein